VAALAARVGRLAAVAALLAMALHLAVLASWRFSLRPWMEGQRHPERLDAPTLRRLPAPPEEWGRLEAGVVRVRAPFTEAPLPGACGAGCRVALPGYGVLALDGSAGPDDYRTTRLLLAPDRDDVSFWALPWRNLETIRALGMRAAVASSPPETFRFEHPGAWGVVARYTNHGIERHVVYAFGPGARAPTLTTSRVAHPTLLAILGSLQVRPPAGAASGRR
jgi:hypothetical protein